MDILTRIRQAGFEIRLKENGTIGIKPFSRLTSEQRGYLKSHKSEILAELRNHPSSNDSGLNDDDRTVIMKWLHFINENNPDIIEEVLDYCRANPEGLSYYLKRAREVPEDYRIIVTNART